jgi:hypothetical protein
VGGKMNPARPVWDMTHTRPSYKSGREILDERPARIILTRISAVSSVGHPLTVQDVRRPTWHVTPSCGLDKRKGISRHCQPRQVSSALAAQVTDTVS